MKIAILGDFDDSENYPNTRHLIAGLKADPRFEITAISEPASKARNLYRSAENSGSRVVMLWQVFWRALRVSSRIRKLTRSDCDAVYVPYPAAIVLFLVSLWPQPPSRRPRIVMDCFISLYDTVVHDRAMLRSNGVRASLLRWVESRAIAVADCVITDTVANATMLEGVFGGGKSKWQALNLCINEDLFRPASAPTSVAKTPAQFEVLFVGSFVPLQGVDVVIKAAIALQHRGDIHFHLLGDGQTAASVQALLAHQKLNLTWDRGWHPIERLAELYRQADICLGVFGATAKASRVLPYKVYMALACGKPVINRQIEMPLPANEPLPMVMVPENDADTLAGKIMELVGSDSLRQQMGRDAREFYQQFLSNQRALDGFYRILSATQEG